jgi:23S rRNA pseudouridine1911/1915/1917 synthase
MSEIWQFEITVPEELHLHRADVVLAKLFSDYSRNQWIEWLRNGTIECEQLVLSPKHKLQFGQRIIGRVEVKQTHTFASPEDISLDIIFEDNDLLIINKPVGLVVHPGAGQPDHTLMNALLFHQQSLAQLPRAGIVHRLDKDTSGLMVIAKTCVTYQRLVDMMQKRQIHRRYIALVHGVMRANGTVSTCYGRHPKNRLKMAVRPAGKIAITHYSINKIFPQNTLLDVELETGRTHQIRVHLSHIGHPIVGDPLYGKTRAPGNNKISEALNLFKRQALHAYQLKFMHPVLQKPLTFEANLPDDFASLLLNIENSSHEIFKT